MMYSATKYTDFTRRYLLSKCHVSQRTRKSNFCKRNVPVGVTFMMYIHLINHTQRIRDRLFSGNWFQPRV